MNQLKKGVLLNYANIVLTNVIGIFITPFILNHLGESEYGIYLTIGAFVGTISLLDFGLNNTVVRFVAKYRAEKDKKTEENFLAITMCIYLLISVLIIIIGLIFYNFYIESYFTKMNHNEIKIAKTIFGILIFNLAIGLPGSAFTGICYSYESFVFPKSVNIIRYISRTIAIFGVLALGGKAISLVIIDTLFNVIVIITTMFFIFKKLKVKFWFHNFSFKYIRKIFSYSAWIFIFGLIAMFQWQVGYLVLGHNSTTHVLTIYGLGITLGSYFGAFSTAISSLFLPRATQMFVNKASGIELTNEMIKIGRVSFIILTYILGAFLLFGEQFVFLWVGDSLDKEASFEIWLIALMIMIAFIVPLVQSFANLILEAQNKLAFKATLYLFLLIVGTGIGAFLSTSYGAIGMISGSLIGWVIGQVIINFYYASAVHLHIFYFFKELLNKIFPIFIISIIICYLFNFMPFYGWMSFIFKCLSYTLVFYSLIYKYGLSKFEKDLLDEILTKMFKKLK